MEKIYSKPNCKSTHLKPLKSTIESILNYSKSVRGVKTKNKQHWLLDLN